MPFIKTAYLSKEGTARPSGSSGEGIIHFGAVRLRLSGQGELKMTLDSLDNVHEQELVPFDCFNFTNIQPTRLCNFNEQRAALTIYTDELNEYFKINRIILFAKDIWSSYPGIS